MSCVFVFILIVSSHYLLLSSFGKESPLDKSLISAVMTCAQIVSSELVLGLFNDLYLRQLVWLNVALSSLVITIGLRHGVGGIAVLLRHDVNDSLAKTREAFDGYNAVLALLFFLSYGWIALSACYLPIRGVDDLYYHLPPLFEYIQSHGIRLLPVAAHTSFAFPENAELLFLWPAIFSSSQRMLSCLNVPFVALSIVAIYALIRRFCASGKDSLFSAFLFAFCPVVIMQSGSNYIDIIVALFIVVSLYFALKFHDTGKVVYLYAASVSIGLVSGMKYTALFLTIPMHLLVLGRIRRTNWLHVIPYFVISASLCGWWYLRNAFVLGDPFYPMGIITHLFCGNSPNNDGLLNLHVIGSNFLNWFLHYPLEDTGIGSYDGGFGPAFWGVAFPAWIYVFCHSLLNSGKISATRLFTLLQLPLSFTLLLLVPKNNIAYAGRFSIFAVTIGLLALCLLFELLQDRVFTLSIKVLCIIFSLMSVSLMSVSVSPSFSLSGVLSDRLNNKKPSEYKYLKDSLAEYTEYRYLFEPLDLLTRDNPEGLTCYIAARTNLINAAPVYGSRLQNRVLNFSPDNREAADAYLYFFPDRTARMLGGNLVPQDIRISGSVSVHDLLTGSDYVMVSHCGCACLLLKRSIVAKAEVKRLLSTYYSDTWPEVVETAHRIAPKLRENIPIVTSHYLGYGLRQLEYSTYKSNRVIMTLEDMENETASPLNGYNFKKLSDIVFNGKNIELFINSRISAKGVPHDKL